MNARLQRIRPDLLVYQVTLVAALYVALVIGCDNRGAVDAPATQPASTLTSTDHEPAAVGAIDTHTLRFRIEGMTCQGCVRAITKEIQKHETVQTCIVSLEDGSAIVVTRNADDALILRKAISSLGYEAALQEQDGEKAAPGSEPAAGDASETSRSTSDAQTG